ncbi:MAG: SRPBCC family protein [Pseudomonadota bacterium]
MKFATKEDVEAPISTVFGMLSDFEVFERSAIRRGAEVNRVGEHEYPREGQTWRSSFVLRGKTRNVEVELVRYAPPMAMEFEAISGGLTTKLNVDLVALASNRTRITVEFDVKPRTLPARLFVQSMKLAKNNLTKRYKLRVAEFARTIEEKYTRLA